MNGKCKNAVSISQHLYINTLKVINYSRFFSNDKHLREFQKRLKGHPKSENKTNNTQTALAHQLLLFRPPSAFRCKKRTRSHIYPPSEQQEVNRTPLQVTDSRHNTGQQSADRTKGRGGEENIMRKSRK